MKYNLSFKNYAKYYDFIYQDKNYNRECNFIEEIFETTKNSQKILEIGCDIGNYAKILLSRGYKITGIDISNKMLKIAREKLFPNLHGKVDENVWNMCIVTKAKGRN